MRFSSSAPLLPSMLVALISTIFYFSDLPGEVLNQGGNGPACVF